MQHVHGPWCGIGCTCGMLCWLCLRRVCVKCGKALFVCVQALMKVSKSLTWHGEPSPAGSLALWGLGLLACCEGLQEQLLLAGELQQQAWQP